MTREGAHEDLDSADTLDHENSAVLAAAVLAHVGDLDSRLQLAKPQTAETDTKRSVFLLVVKQYCHIAKGASVAQ